jgi:hypothetical protein
LVTYRCEISHIRGELVVGRVKTRSDQVAVETIVEVGVSVYGRREVGDSVGSRYLRNLRINKNIIVVISA